MSPFAAPVNCLRSMRSNPRHFCFMTDSPITFRGRIAARLARHRESLNGSVMSLVVHATLLLILAVMVFQPRNASETILLTVHTDDDASLSLDPELNLTPTELRQGEVQQALQQFNAISDQPTPLTLDYDPSPRLRINPDLEAVLGPDAPRASDFAGRSASARTALVQAYGGTLESEAAVNNGLKWLVAHQRGDGSWNFDHTHADCGEECTHPGRSVQNTVAATSFALLCFLGAGHTHLEGEYVDEVSRGLTYLLDKAEMTEHGADLREITSGSSGMYSQGLATIVLCEAYGLSKDRQLQQRAQFAVNYVCNAQHPRNGGWRYAFRPEDGVGDTSVTGWQVMAITSARMSDLRVPLRTRQQATRFLNSVQAGEGGFYGYVDPGRKPSTTAVGLLCRMYLGWESDHAGIIEGVQFLAERGPSREDMYYNYYATQVLHHWGGADWADWNNVMREQLVRSQDREGHSAGSWSPFNPDGSRRDPHGADTGGRLYATALAVLTLEVYYRHLPLYQRRSVEADLSAAE